VVNGPRIQQLKLDLARCKQDGMSVVTYYGKLKLLWDDLANYDQIPVCSCGRCKCDISSKLEKRREEERVHQFLMGLDDAIYGTVRSNLLATDPLPNLNRVYSTMIQEERVKTMTRTTEERREVMSLAVQTNGRAVKGSWDGKDKCTHCHREGHEAGGCFQLVGYPDWWGDRPKIEGKYGGRGKPIQRSGTGRGRRGTARANAVHTGGTSSETAISQGDGSGLAGITAEQLQTLVGLLNAQKTNCNDKMTGEYDTSTWIIDTGCSNHMTGNLKHMRELQDIQSCPVGLPNGEHAAAVKQGSVVLEGGLKLTNVLFVPKLNCNLISVSQMMDELKCVIQFTNKLCVVQDRTSRTLIGAGERKDGLYFFRGVRRERTYKIDGLHPMDLWHKRLGHPSLKITHRSKKCVFIGYPYGKKGWKLFDLETEDIFVSRDVEFIETKFPFATDITSRKDGHSSNCNLEEFVDDFDGVEETDHTLGTQESNDMRVDNMNSKLDGGIDAGSSQNMNIQETTLSSTTSTTSDNEEVDEQGADLQNMDKEDTMSPSIPVAEPMLGRGHRIKQPSIRLQNHVTNTARRLSPSNCPPPPKVNSGAPYPITNYVNYDHFSIAHRAFLSAVSQEK
ncbi:hypothetical protein L195_g031833, partial [Trifolium pratense]